MNHLTKVEQGATQEGPAEAGIAEADIQKQSLLQRCDVFAGLPSQTMSALARRSSLVMFPRRSPVYRQGEPARSLFVLTGGRARVSRRTGSDRALTVAYRVNGELIGETALLDGHNYQDSASATERVEALEVPLSQIEELLAGDPDFASRMLRLMTARRLEAERRIEGLLSRTVEARVAEFLLDAAQRHGIPDSRGTLIGVKFTHQEIADYVGSTRETVTLTLGDFKRRGILLFDHRRIVLVEPERLEALLQAS